jgi:site-specific recombinase XerD
MLIKQILLADRRVFFRFLLLITLKTYRHWLKRFQAFTRSKPPESLSAVDVKEFLTWLVVKKQVAASTQNQAFNALQFFYRHVLEKEFGKLEGVVRAKRKEYIPVVLSREEIDKIVSHLALPVDSGVAWPQRSENHYDLYAYC